MTNTTITDTLLEHLKADSTEYQKKLPKAFCCISTGEFHFPNDEAAKIAIETVTDFLAAHEDAVDRIIFNVFKDTDREIYKHTMKRLLMLLLHNQ